MSIFEKYMCRKGANFGTMEITCCRRDGVGVRDTCITVFHPGGERLALLTHSVSNYPEPTTC